MEFINAATPRTESELAVMVALLDAHEILHFVQNRGFGGLYPGMQIPLYNVRKIMVPIAQASAASALLSVFALTPNEIEDQRLGLFDRLRVVIESLLGGWTFPVRWKPVERNFSDK